TPPYSHTPYFPSALSSGDNRDDDTRDEEADAEVARDERQPLLEARQALERGRYAAADGPAEALVLRLLNGDNEDEGDGEQYLDEAEKNQQYFQLSGPPDRRQWLFRLPGGRRGC